MDHTDRICAYLILTAFVQLIGSYIYFVHPSFGILYFIAFIVLLLLAFLQFTDISVYEKRYLMIQNPAEFDINWIDCYVRVTGKVADTCHRLPINGKECAFYTSSVIANWKTKMKKPGKGILNQRKPLLTDKSSDSLEVKVGNHSVYIIPNAFNPSMNLDEIKKYQDVCPEQIQINEDEKYKKTYAITERFVSREEVITAQGKLVQRDDGRLFIQPSDMVEYPSFALIHKKNNVEKYIDGIMEKTLNDYLDIRFRVFFFALNAFFFGAWFIAS
jgi:hypothetical protein